jgi:membrane protein DedA with SNARE-associated domain
VLVGRVTPLARSFVSIPAGVFRTPLYRYTVLTAIGSAIWAFGLAAIGWAVGKSYESFHHDFRYVDYAVVAGIMVLLAYLILRRRRATRLARRAEDPAH